MAAAPVSLDQGPPQPPQLQPQGATADQLAGSATPDGSAALQSQVIQKLMFVEQTLTDVATMAPMLTGPVNAVIDMMRKGIGTALARGLQAPPAQGFGAGSSGLMAPVAPTS